jgi:cytoskeletal protein RodZ
VTDWNFSEPQGERPDADDPLSDLDWSAGPVDPAVAPTPVETVPDAPTEERIQEPRRRGSAPVRRQGNHTMDMRISRAAFWGLLVLALVIGAAGGVGVLVWQRTALTAQIRALETKVATAEANSAAAGQQVADLEARVASAETSFTDLTAQNTQLAADLAAARAALASAQSAGTITFTERSVSPTSVEASHTLALTVKLKGNADKVQVRIVGTGTVSSYTKTTNLTKSTTSADVVTWKRSVTAPGKTGTYRYYATAYIGTKKYEMAGVSAWTFVVK